MASWPLKHRMEGSFWRANKKGKPEPSPAVQWPKCINWKFSRELSHPIVNEGVQAGIRFFEMPDTSS